MRFSNLGQYSDLSVFSNFRFYEKPISDKTPLNVTVAVKAIQLKHGTLAAESSIAKLILACDEAIARGDILSLAEVIPKSIPPAGILKSMLMRFSSAELSAIMVALSEEMALEDVVRLKRSEALERRWKPTAATFVRGATPRLGSPWLFWRERAGIAMPLLDLPTRWSELMPMSWAEFRDGFNRHGYKLI